MDLQIFVDKGPVEVIPNGGQLYGSVLVFPNAGNRYGGLFRGRRYHRRYLHLSPFQHLAGGGYWRERAFLDYFERRREKRFGRGRDDHLCPVMPDAAPQAVEWKIEDRQGLVKILSQNDNSITLMAAAEGDFSVTASAQGGKVSKQST